MLPYIALNIIHNWSVAKLKTYSKQRSKFVEKRYEGFTVFSRPLLPIHMSIMRDFVKVMANRFPVMKPYR